MIAPRLCPHGILGIKKCKSCRNAYVTKFRAKESESDDDLEPIAAIAEELGLSHAAVQSTLRRALAKLRDGRAECLKGFEF